MGLEINQLEGCEGVVVGGVQCLRRTHFIRHYFFAAVEMERARHKIITTLVAVKADIWVYSYNIQDGKTPYTVLVTKATTEITGTQNQF